MKHLSPTYGTINLIEKNGWVTLKILNDGSYETRMPLDYKFPAQNNYIGDFYSEAFNKSVLVLGAGLGEAARVFRNENPTSKIVQVEIDPVIAKLNEKYTGIPVVVEDAVEYMKKDNEFYDQIIIDIFDNKSKGPNMDVLRALAPLIYKKDKVEMFRISINCYKASKEDLAEVVKLFIKSYSSYTLTKNKVLHIWTFANTKDTK